MANMKVVVAADVIKKLGKDINDISEQAFQRVKQAVATIAAQTHEKILQRTESLGSRRQAYTGALKIENISDNDDVAIWAVTLNKSAKWIEDGMPAGNRIEAILNGGSPAKVSKSGKKFKIIPFKHNKPPTQQSKNEQKMADYIKSHLKKAGLDKVIKDDQGNPIFGKVGTVSINDPGQPVSKTGNPILKGLTVYQKKHTTASGKVQVKRDVMTFRVVSESQLNKSPQPWTWQEQKGVNFFEEVQKEIDADFEEAIKKALE